MTTEPNICPRPMEVIVPIRQFFVEGALGEDLWHGHDSTLEERRLVQAILHINEDPISKLTPDLPAALFDGMAQAGMLYRQVQFLVDESDRPQQGKKVQFSFGGKEL